MTSANRRRNRNRNAFQQARLGRQPGRGRMGALGSMDLVARRDLIVSGGYVNNAGAQVATNGWNGAAIVLAGGSQAAYQAIVIPQAVTAINAPPSIGECQVDAIEGSLFLTTPSAAGIYYIGFGIYVSKFDTRTGTWAVRYPSNSAADAARDDWVALRAMVMTLPLAAGISDPMILELKLVLPHPIILGGGEALHVCVDNNGSSVGNISVTPYFRTRIADVT